MAKLNIFNDIAKYRIGGRVQIFGGKKIKVNKCIVSLDVCSLYPYVMGIAPNYYPCGEIVETANFKPDKLGFYWCNINQSELKKKNLMNIIPKKCKGENDWEFEGDLTNYYLSTVDIELLQKYNVKLEIKNGIYFTDKIKGCD
jgi:hypothetical protein